MKIQNTNTLQVIQVLSNNRTRKLSVENTNTSLDSMLLLGIILISLLGIIILG
ncbi:MAG: hypothetical protein K9J12_15735 [Melioribacteraceae bacterium]|nr:hypothetical protein [Melioribacteraceae bacterium]MCF8413186.1 hypothetical protein [Melioribacteraceae bacterium]